MEFSIDWEKDFPGALEKKEKALPKFGVMNDPMAAGQRTRLAGRVIIGKISVTGRQPVALAFLDLN